MEHDLELIIARLEILEIGVCNILYNPGNIGKRTFLIQSYPGNIGNSIFPIFRISWKYWKYDFSWFLWFWQKRRAPKFHAEWSNFHAEISHMRPIQARKLKLFQTPIPRWRRRRRADNSPIWPDPWTITPRDQISRSGSIPHFDIRELQRLPRVLELVYVWACSSITVLPANPVLCHK